MTESRKTHAIATQYCMCEKERGGHCSFAAKAIESLFAVFKSWRCTIMYSDWRTQVLRRSTLGKRTIRVRHRPSA